MLSWGIRGHNYSPLILLQISGKDALEKTTLKSLGLTGGNAIVRLGEAKLGFFIFPFHSGAEFILFQVPKEEEKKKSHKRRFQTKTSWHSEVIAFACLSQTAAQMCFSQQQMLALTSHVQIKRACLFVSFFSSSFEWNGQFKVKSLSERAVSYHFILPCSGSQALNSQPLQALLAVGG